MLLAGCLKLLCETGGLYSQIEDTTPARSRGAIAAVPHECAVLAVMALAAQDGIWASVMILDPGVLSTGHAAELLRRTSKHSVNDR